MVRKPGRAAGRRRRRDGLAADAQLPVVACCIAAHSGLGQQLADPCPGTPANCRSSSWSQFCPYWCGVLTRVTRLVPKTSAASTAARATVAAASALRTGTARGLAWPERHPDADAARHGAGQVSAGPAVSRGAGRRCRPAQAGPAHRAAPPGHREQCRQRRDDVTTSPAPSVAKFTSRRGGVGAGPPDGHQRRGRDGDADRDESAAAGHRAARARDRAVSVARVMPRARRVGNSAASRMSWRPMSGHKYHQREQDPASVAKRPGRSPPGGWPAPSRRLRGQVREAEPSSGRVAPGQYCGPPHGRRPGRARPQPHVGGVPGTEPAARATAPETGVSRTRGAAGQPGSGHHLVVEGDHRGYPEGQRAARAGAPVDPVQAGRFSRCSARREGAACCRAAGAAAPPVAGRP